MPRACACARASISWRRTVASQSIGFMARACAWRRQVRSGMMDAMRKITAISDRPLVAAVVADGFSAFEFSAVCEIFGEDLSAEVPSWYRFAICSPSPAPVHASMKAVSVVPTASFEVLEVAETIVVLPFGDLDHPPLPLLDALRRAQRRGARVASICTGAFALAAAGLLDRRVATTHWAHAGELASRFPALSVDPNVLYVDDGDVLTSAGSASGIDLCLHLVRQDFGAEVANRIARGLVVQPHRDGGQAQYVDRPVPEFSTDDPFSATLAWIEEHLDEPISIDALARRAMMSPRTFARRFVTTTGASPHRWITRQRVFLAQRLLETTDLRIDEIARNCGFGTATTLRQHFRSVVTSSPAAYRRSFREAVA